MVAAVIAPFTSKSHIMSQNTGKGAGKMTAQAKAAPRKTAARRRVAGPVAAAAGASLVLRFMDASGAVDIERLSAELGLTKTQLAETAGLGRDTLQKTTRRNAPKTQTRVREMLEVLSRVEDWAGGQAQAVAWYRSQPIPALDGRTAEALVKSGHAGVVREYLDQIALGGFA
jgi:uncharacterized protein (DUF2384 family)